MRDNAIQEPILDSSPIPSNTGGPQKVAEYLREMLIESKKPKDTEQVQCLEQIQQKVSNIMGPLRKLLVGLSKVKFSGKSGEM